MLTLQKVILESHKKSQIITVVDSAGATSLSRAIGWTLPNCGFSVSLSLTTTCRLSLENLSIFFALQEGKIAFSRYSNFYVHFSFLAILNTKTQKYSL
jgi:hypothetical protein